MHEWPYSDEHKRLESTCLSFICAPPLRCDLPHTLAHISLLGTLDIIVRPPRSPSVKSVHARAFCTKLGLHATHGDSVTFKAKRAALGPRRAQHCTFPHENRARRNSTHHQRLRFISFFPHLTWEGTPMRNSLMVYRCWGACVSVLVVFSSVERAR